MKLKPESRREGKLSGPFCIHLHLFQGMDWISHFRRIFIEATRCKLCFQLLDLHKFPVASQTFYLRNNPIKVKSWLQKKLELESWTFPPFLWIILLDFPARMQTFVQLRQQRFVAWHIRDRSDTSVFNLYTDSYKGYTDALIHWY